MPPGRRRSLSDISARGQTGGGAAGVMQEAERSLGVQGAPTGNRFGTGQLVIRPPYEFPPSSARFFNASGYASVSNAAANTPTALSIALPAGAVGVIRGLGLNVNNLTTSSDVRWDLLVNGNAVPGFSNLTIFPRAAASVSLSWDSTQIAVIVPDGATIALQLRVGAGDGTTYQMGGNFTGWSYSKSVAQQFAAANL